MRYSRLLTLVFVLLLAATPLAALAQDGPEFEEFESEDGLFTMEYPAEWTPYADDENPLPNIGFFNTEHGLEAYDNDEDPASGDAGILIFVLPTEFFALMGMPITEDMSATDVTEMVAMAFFAQDEEDAGEDIELGEIEEWELEDGSMVGYLDVEGDTEEGGFFVFEAGEDLLGIGIVSTFPGEYDDDLYLLAETVVESVEFTGSADDVMNALLSGDMGDDDDDGEDESMGAGAMLVEERCSVCHSTDRIYSADKDEAGWTETVDRMIDYGAQLDDDERATVIEYLAGMN